MTVRRALVVEDEPANQDFLVRLIQQAGFEVFGADNAEDAMAAASAHDDFLLIAVDLELPDMSGLTLVSQLREILPECILIVVTMWDDPTHIEAAFTNGCDAFLVKPHGFMELFRRIQALPANRDQVVGLIFDQYGPRPYQ